MKILESSPSRYDRGIKLITLGKIPQLYQELTQSLSADHRVLDIGCGTGLISLLAAHRGASVKGIDINPEALTIARRRLVETSPTGDVEFIEMGIAELDGETTDEYDYIYAGLVFSELEDYEQDFALKQIIRLLKPGGTFVLIDEITPSNPILRIVQTIIRLPLMILTYLLTQTTTKSLKNIVTKLTAQGFTIIQQDRYLLSSLTVIRSRN